MKMKKYILSAFVCSLAACGGGGGGHKIHLTPMTGQVFEFDFPAEGMEDEQEYNSFVSLSGYKSSLNFEANKNGDLVSIRQVVVNSEGVENPGTWASLDFPLSLFSVNDIGLIQASIVKNFNMQGSGLSFVGENKASITLGGAAVGLSYSDFGFLFSDVSGIYTDPGETKSYTWSLSQPFQGGNDENLIGETDWVKAIPANSPLQFSGLAFATLAGTVGGVSSSTGGFLVGNASLELDNDGRIDLEVDFSGSGAGVWTFFNEGSGYSTYLNGVELTDGTPTVQFNVYGTPASDTQAPIINEAVGMFEHEIDKDNYLSGNFGVKKK